MFLGLKILKLMDVSPCTCRVNIKILIIIGPIKQQINFQSLMSLGLKILNLN